MSNDTTTRPGPSANDGGWETFVLLPASDVPRSGSRTEITVTPGQCLRVQVRETRDGRLELRRAP